MSECLVSGAFQAGIFRGVHLKKRLLIIYYSFTQQTRLLVKNFAAGLEQQGIEVTLERLKPIAPYEFPFRTDLRLARAMTLTFFRKRDRIEEIESRCYDKWDLIVLAGPTWSYHPSGPVLDFMDRFAALVCSGKTVLILISARSYWRIHYWSLKRMLKKVGASVAGPIVYQHPIREPYRFMGLLLQLRGRMIRKPWFREHYPGYGNSKAQQQDCFNRGVSLGRELNLKG